MTTLNISLPDDLKKLVDRQVMEGGFASHSEYVRSLIRKDQKRLERERIESKLLERLEAGASVEMTDRDFEKIRARLKSHLARTRKK
jgi:antitoxin ParD1/3/4